jgi:threonine-phosphate decarboxylase
MITGHGGNVTALAERLGCRRDEITDMSSNLNPLGPPPGLEAFLQDSIRAIRSLPQADARDMVLAFSRHHDIDPGRVMAGNGTTWFLYTLPAALASRKVLILGPTYSDYRDGCLMQGVPFGYSMAVKETGFTPDLDQAARLLDKGPLDFDTVVLCNPNNPTGVLAPGKRILELAAGNPGVRFVVDESYLPFADDAEALSLVRETRFPNLVVLSSMSKIFTIPGLRTGFVIADPSLIRSWTRWYQPWSVNALAQAAVVHLLGQGPEMGEFLRKSRLFMNRERALFQQRLAGCPGLTLFGSETSFVLAELTGKARSADICRAVGDRRILIRDCANFDGLSDRFVRFSLKTPEINRNLAAILAGLPELGGPGAAPGPAGER